MRKFTPSLHRLSILILLVLSMGCERLPALDVTHFTPADAKNVNVQNVDFEDDGASERVITYTGTDNADHLSIFQYENQTWQMVMTSSYPHLKKTEVLDFGKDGKPELLVQSISDNPSPGFAGSYSIIALRDGGLREKDATLINEGPYRNPAAGEVAMVLSDVQVKSDHTEEHYSIICGKGEKCREVVLRVDFENGNFKRTELKK